MKEARRCWVELFGEEGTQDSSSLKRMRERRWLDNKLSVGRMANSSSEHLPWGLGEVSIV